MKRSLILLALACTAVAAGCSDSHGPTGPTPRTPRISHTRFLAFGDSFTAGEVTDPIAGQWGVVIGELGEKSPLPTPNSPLSTLIGKQVVVPSASYPSQLQTQLRSTYTSQGSAITVVNGGEPGERILDGNQRFPSVFDASRPEVLLIMEGANGLAQVGPDISTGIMRIMVQIAKTGGARVFVGSMIPQVAGRPRGTTAASELVAYNNVLQIMSTQEAVTYVDLYNPMLAEAATLIGSDGLHPTEAGYRRIADLFFVAIRAALQE